VDGLTDRGRPPACCGAVLRARRGRSVPFAPSRGLRSINANRAPVSIDRLVPHLALASAAPTRGAQTRALAADFRHPAERRPLSQAHCSLLTRDSAFLPFH
jgi:hypothetical protein